MGELEFKLDKAKTKSRPKLTINEHLERKKTNWYLPMGRLELIN